MTQLEYAQHQAKLKGSRREAITANKPCEREVGKGGLHGQIQDHCRKQHPRWLVISSRTDKPSTLPNGCHDMTIFASNSRVFCFELKSKDGKLSAEQQDWICEMRMVGHEVVIVDSFEQFMELVK